MSGWIKIKGDGTDTEPAVWRMFEARLRGGSHWHDCCVTPFCAAIAPGYFQHGNAKGEPRDHDVIAIRFYDQEQAK